MTAHDTILQTAAPTSFGNHDDIDHAFDGDLSNLHWAFEKRISGAATLGQPVNSYEQHPENAAIYGNVYNTSGHNESTGSAGPGGRTGASVIDLRFTQAGQGDFAAIFMKGVVTSSKAGATSFFSNPAAVLMNGDLFSTVVGGYMTPFEFNVSDLGFQSAAIGGVFNFDRSVATATLGEVWFGVRPQSRGSAHCDVAYSVNGKWKRVLDTTDAELTSDKAAILLKAGQRIYFEGVNSGVPAWGQSVGNAFIESDATKFVFVYDSVPVFQLNDDLAVIYTAWGLQIDSTGSLRMAGANQFTTGTKTATFSATNKPGTNNNGPSKWMKVLLAGSTFWIPCWAN